MKIQSNMYINNPDMTSRNIEKKENSSHALVQEDDIHITLNLHSSLLIHWIIIVICLYSTYPCPMKNHSIVI